MDESLPERPGKPPIEERVLRSRIALYSQRLNDRESHGLSIFNGTLPNCCNFGEEAIMDADDWEPDAAVLALSEVKDGVQPASGLIPLNRIDPSPHNSRETFDEEAIFRLAESIRVHGLLNPIVVRPRGERIEIVAGESRFRAVQLLGWEQIEATVRELTDVQAAEVGLLENLAREDLNAIEQAHGLQTLLDLGHTTETVGRLLSMRSDAVVNSVKLLSLPTFWTERIRSGKLSAAAGEYLIPWTPFPQLLKRLQRSAKRFPMPLSEWRSQINDAVLHESRDMNPDNVDGPLFRVNDDVAKELNLVDLRLSSRQIVRRAMNTDLWDRLQKQAAEVIAMPSTGLDPIQPVLGPAQANFGAAWHRKWLRDVIVARIDHCDIDGLNELASAMRINIETELQSTAHKMGIDPAQPIEQLVTALAGAA